MTPEDRDCQADDQRVLAEMLEDVRQAGRRLRGSDADSAAGMLRLLGSLTAGAADAARQRGLVSTPGHQAGASDGGMQELRVTSPDFVDGGRLPIDCAAEGQDRSPELRIDGTDPAAVSMVVTAIGPDRALLGSTAHWLLWNVPLRRRIPAGIERGRRVPALGLTARQGRTGTGFGYSGPRRGGNGPQRVVFSVSILDGWIELGGSPGWRRLAAAMDGHVLQCGETVAFH